MSFSVERISERSVLEADANWWRVYEQSFSPEVRASRDALLRVLEHPRVLFLRARVDGQTIGLVTMQTLLDPNVSFLGYFAIDSSFRGHGYGTKFLKHAMEAGAESLLKEGRTSIGMILESAYPGTGHEQDASDHLYEKIGFRHLDMFYAQPPLNGQNAVPLRLLFCPSWEGLRLTQQTMVGLVAALYEQKYEASYQVERAVLRLLLKQTAESLGLDPVQQTKALLKTV